MKDEIIKVISEWMMQQDDSIIGDRIAHRQLANDLTALISEHYYPKEKYDELKDSLVDMVNQFAYRGTYEGRENMHTGGLSALEDAFATLGLSDPITLIDFYAAIKNTER